MIFDKWEAEIGIISEFWVTGKLQCTGIYGKLKCRNKLWSCGKLEVKSICTNNKKHYLCGGNNKFNKDWWLKVNHKVNQRKEQIGIDLIIKLIEVIFIFVWGARGRWFESSHPDTNKSIDNLMIVNAFCFICLFYSTILAGTQLSTYICNRLKTKFYEDS